ncbi:hypothetical protein AGMMS49965_17380 [Bacteroidia bacterium]|nr:hypothetical protein AGMMS49965_17380 [Bacteroidia bacterium]
MTASTNKNNIFVDTNVLIGAWAIVHYLLSKFTVLSFTDKDIEDSLGIEGTDMEDNIQYVISREFNCLHFTTNNKKDYNRFYILNIIAPTQIRVIKR